MRVPTCLWPPAVFLSLLAGLDNTATFSAPRAPSEGERNMPPLGASGSKPAAATDLHGDPLPPGAVVRLGTIRFRRTVESGLHGLAFLADNKTVLTAEGSEVQFWNVADGRLVRTLPSPVPIYGFAVAPNRRQIAVAGPAVVDGNPRAAAIHILDVNSGKSLQAFKRNEFREISFAKLAFSPDGAVLFSAVRDVGLRGEEIASGKEVLRKQFGRVSAQDLAVSSDGRHLAFASGQVVYLWKWRDEEPRPLLDKTSVKAIRFSPDGKLVAAVSEDEKLHLWQVTDRKLIGSHNLRAQKNVSFFSIEFTHDGRTLLVGSRPFNPMGRGQILMLDPLTGQDKGVIAAKDMGYFVRVGLALSADSTLLACPRGQGLQIFDLQTRKHFATDDAHATAPMSVCFSPHGHAVTCADDNTVRVWDAKTGKHLRVHRFDNMVRTIAVSPDGKLLVTSSYDDTVRVMDLKSGREIYRLPGHGQTGSQPVLAFTSDGRSFFSWGNDFYLRRWDVRTGRALLEHAIRPSGVELPDPDNPNDFQRRELLMIGLGSAAVTPDGKTFVLDCLGHHYWFDTATGREMKKTSGGGGRFGSSLMASPNGKYVLTGQWGQGNSHSMALRDTTADASIAVSLPGSVAGPVIFSPDGRSFATSVESTKEIRVFETASMKERYRIRNIPGRVHSLAFLPDGRRLASGLADSTVLIWDLTAPTKE